VPVSEDDDGPSAFLAVTTAITVLQPMAQSVPGVPSGRLRMLVIGEGVFATPALPDVGEVTIGRSRRNDVCIEDDLVSRHHATLRTGEAITIEDHGSANGTTVRGQRLAPHERVAVHVGDLITLGSTNVVIQKRAGESRPRRRLTHALFEGRVDDECARSARSGNMFAVLQVRALGDGDAQPSEDVVEHALAEVVRQSDIVGSCGTRAYEVLLLDATPPVAEQIAQRLGACLEQRGVASRIATACYPRDGRSAQQLLAAPGSPDAIAPVAMPDGMLVADPVMLDLYRLVERIATSSMSVLVLGETGVGKAVLAAAVHRSSPRAHGPFVQLNCAALTETLLESELFGYEKGAFAGAHASKIGLLETANGGTLMLDEVGDMPLSVQAKLVRVIEERQARRLGSAEAYSIDVRFIAATNRDLEHDAQRFRRDLYFRLNNVTLSIPPLRERVAEIEPFARAFAARAAAQSGQPTPNFTAAATESLRGYSWPGNVRELRNVVERAVLLSDGAPIAPEHLMRGHAERRPRGTQPNAPVDRDRLVVDRRRLDPSEPDEMQRILDALERANGNQTKAAEMLGVSRRTLINRLDEYGFARPRKKKEPT
jgi:DNA-binding NtrC family response regulator